MTHIKGMTPDQIATILKIIHLRLPKVTVYAYGSRVNGKPRKYSDLDIALDDGRKIGLSVILQLKESLSETNIPFSIDIIDYHSIGPTFKRIVDNEKIIL